MSEGFEKFIRDVCDFPKKGIIFKDITPLIANAQKFREVIDIFTMRSKDKKIDKVVAIDARGFIFGSAVAYNLGAGLAIVRKKGKLPYRTHRQAYDLEYGTDTLEMHEDAISPGERVLIMDDLLATGGTTEATAKLVEKLGGEIVEINFVIELAFLNGRRRIKKYPVFSLIKY